MNDLLVLLAQYAVDTCPTCNANGWVSYADYTQDHTLTTQPCPVCSPLRTYIRSLEDDDEDEPINPLMN